jgi:hypothetical protein
LVVDIPNVLEVKQLFGDSYLSFGLKVIGKPFESATYIGVGEGSVGARAAFTSTYG